MKAALVTIVSVLLATFVSTSYVAAITIDQNACTTVQDSALCAGKDENVARGGNGQKSFVQQLTETILFLIGIAAVVAIILGGIRYTTANGDASKIKSAKDTIMYAVIGLVVALMAWAIVTFVVNRTIGASGGAPAQQSNP